MAQTTLSKQIRSHRERLGWTQEHLAALIGVEQPTVCRWESGDRRGIKLDNLQRLAKVLKVTVSDLLTVSK